MKLCACGRTIWTLGKRCRACQAVHRTTQAETRAAKGFVKHERAASERDNPEHAAWVRTLPCSVHGCRNRPSQAAHIRHETNGGIGIKPSPQWMVPLCAEHHHGQHCIGEPAFERKHGINLKAIAVATAARSPFLR